MERKELAKRGSTTNNLFFGNHTRPSDPPIPLDLDAVVGWPAGPPILTWNSVVVLLGGGLISRQSKACQLIVVVANSQQLNISFLLQNHQFRQT